MSEQSAIGDSVGNAVARGALIKLVLFSLSLGIVPLSSYFVSQKYLWEGNSTYAAITAVVSANVVLFAYIITSLLEDSPPSTVKPLLEEKKQQ